MAALSLTDITNSIKNAKVCFQDSALKNGIPEIYNGRLVCYSGNYGAVFKLKCGSKQKAVRIWTKDLSVMPELPTRAELLSKKIRTLNNPSFVDFEFKQKGLLVSGQWTPVVVMDWCTGKNLKDAILENISNPSGLIAISSNFLMLIRLLHEQGVSHGDLQHGNILINSDFSIKLIDYDSLYIPSKEFDEKIEEIKGLPDYQHPARMANKYANSKVDYFSELVIYLTLSALAESPDLWKKYNVVNRDYSLLFDQNDFLDFRRSKIYADLCKLSPTIECLVSILAKYLDTDDINKLSPFDVEAEKLGYTLYQSVLNSEFCINCGREFLKYEDVYCTNCGTKRYGY